MNKMAKIAKNLGDLAAKNSPHILTGLGCAGLLSTAILSAKATPKAVMILEDEEVYREKKHFTPMTKLDKVKLTWKCYIPATVVGGISIGCIIGANTVNTRRNAALASLYAMSETAFREYKSKVVEEIGKNKATKIYDETIKDKIIENPPKDNVIITGNGDVMCLDLLSGRYFESSLETIRQKINELNYDLRSEMRMNLNEYYYSIGLSPIPLGEMVGFDLEKGQIEAVYSTQMTPDGKPCIAVDLYVYPIF